MYQQPLFEGQLPQYFQAQLTTTITSTIIFRSHFTQERVVQHVNFSADRATPIKKGRLNFYAFRSSNFMNKRKRSFHHMSNVKYHLRSIDIFLGNRTGSVVCSLSNLKEQ